jgi:hypothetical protein
MNKQNKLYIMNNNVSEYKDNGTAITNKSAEV